MILITFIDTLRNVFSGIQKNVKIVNKMADEDVKIPVLLVVDVAMVC